MPNGLEKDTNGCNVREITGGFVDAALSFIKQAKQDQKSFYLNLWPDDVHSPFWPPVDQVGGREKAHTLSCRVRRNGPSAWPAFPACTE